MAAAIVAILAATRPNVLDGPSSGAAIVVLMPRLMSVEPDHRLRQDAVQVELVNHLVERIGAGRVVSAPFATTLRELEIILAAQADRDVPILVVETVVRIIRTDVRLTATLLAWDGYGVVQSTTSTDFILDNAAAGLIEVPRAIGASVADEFAPLLAPSGH